MNPKQPKTSSKDRSGTAVKTGPQAEPFVSEVCYIKKSTCAFQLRFADISKREDRAWKSHDVNWKIPGFDTGASQERGVTHEIYETEVNIENVSPVTLLFRMQKPMGFKDDPSALAMWEPVVQGKGGKETLLVEVRPHSHRTLRFNNHESGVLCPRQSFFDGNAAVHLYSLVPFREPETDSGFVPSYEKPVVPGSKKGQATSYFPSQQEILEASVAMIVTTTIHFKTNDSASGETKDDFVIETFEGSNRLDETTPGPAVPIRLCDLHVPGGNVSAGAIFEASFAGAGGAKHYWCLGFYSAGASAGKPANGVYTDVDNLDKASTYELPFPVPCQGYVDPTQVTLARYVRWSGPQPDGAWPNNTWVVGAYQEPAGEEQSGVFHFLRPFTGYTSIMMPPSVRLTPVSGSGTLHLKASRGRIKAMKIANPSLHRALAARKAQVQSYVELKQLDSTVGDTLLGALTVITKVVTVAIEIASIFGFAAVPLNTTRGQPLELEWHVIG